jgi:hypothetical protein
MFKNKFKDILFCCVGAQFIQNLSHNLEMLIYLPLADKFNDIGWLFLSLGMSIIVYLALLRFFLSHNLYLVVDLEHLFL